MSSSFDKFAILESFLDEVNSYLPEIEAGLDRLQQRPDDMDAIEETYRRAHTIAGSSAMMDFGALAQVAQGMEDILGDAIDRNAPLDAPTVALLRRSFARLSRLVAQIRDGGDNSQILTEDQADRSAWRGAASNRAAGGAGAPPMGGAPQPGEAQLPAWLTQFAGQDGGMQATPPPPGGPQASVWGSAPGIPNTPSTASQSGVYGGFGAGGPAASTSERWAQSNSFPAQRPPQAPQPHDYAINRELPDPWSSSTTNIPARGGAPAASSPAQPPFAQPPAASYPQQSPSASGSAIESLPTNAWPFPNAVPQDFGAARSAAPAPPDAPRAEEQPTFDDMIRAFQISDVRDGAPPAEGQPQAAHATRQAHPTPPLNTPSSWGSSQAAISSPWNGAASSAESVADIAAQGTSALPVPARAPAPPTTEPQTPESLPQALDELRADEEAVRRQAGALRDVIATLREAARTMEDERLELRSFLDGSRDALDRLEEWAGQHMGLDLRQSPDAVRNFLPLSVIWVTTARLKKLVTLLNNSGRDLTATQEQIEETLGELRNAIGAAGVVYSSVTRLGGSPDQGFSATVAQVTWNPPAAQPVVESQPETRSGGRADASALTAAERTQLERDVRDSLRRELEDEVRAEVAAEVRAEESERLRHELQIEVRRQLLGELTPGLETASAQQSAGGSLLAQLPFTEHAPRQVQVTSEQSPEALEVFREEAQEHLQTITNGIAQLEKSPGDANALQSIRRAMHTLKGAAGMMGFAVVQGLAHTAEDALDMLVEGAVTFSPTVLSLLLDTSEALDSFVTGAIANPREQREVAQALSARYAGLTGAPTPEVAEVASEADTQEVAPDTTDAATEAAGDDALATQQPADAADLSVRLQLSKLDDLVNLFGDLLINRTVLEERLDRLFSHITDTVQAGERVRDVGSQLDSRFEAYLLPSGPGAPGGRALPFGIGRGGAKGQSQFTRDFDELEMDRYTEFHRLSRGLSEGVTDIVTLGHEMESLIRECQASFARENRLSSDFQERLLKARLVPLESLAPKLYRVARASALKEGKEIEFFVEGADTEVDRKVFEEVAGPLLHLVRNAVNHGIERPNVREMEGKPRAGKIVLSASYEGNQVVIAVRDDGAGVNLEGVRETAVARGLVDAYTHLSDREIVNLIFMPGMSTAKAITEESGRGVGLDVVRDSVTRLRGTVEVDSTPGQGSVFTMKFPISLQIARAVLVKVGGQTVAIPMAVVEQIGRLDYYQRVPGAAPAIELRGERYPVAHLASYLRAPLGPVDERASVLLVNAGKRRMALLIDGIVNQQEIVAKPLGSHLRDVRGVAGAAVLGNGQVVVILELLELLALPPREQVTLPEPGARATASRLPAVDRRPTGAMPAIAAPARREPPSQPFAPQAPAAWAGQPASQPFTQPGSQPFAQPGAPSAPAVAGMPTAPTLRTPAAPPPPASSGPVAGGPARDFVVTPRDGFNAAFNRGDSSSYRTVAPPRAIQQQSYLLVVDDSPSVRRVVSNTLKSNGWEVQTARDGIEAMEVIARKAPAAVLLDIEMPRMDGYELMATIRSQEQYRGLPLIVLTSRAASKHQQRALQLGADAYVVKPYQDGELLTTIATLVQARQR